MLSSPYDSFYTDIANHLSQKQALTHIWNDESRSRSYMVLLSIPSAMNSGGLKVRVLIVGCSCNYAVFSIRGCSRLWGPMHCVHIARNEERPLLAHLTLTDSLWLLDDCPHSTWENPMQSWIIPLLHSAAFLLFTQSALHWKITSFTGKSLLSPVNTFNGNVFIISGRKSLVFYYLYYCMYHKGLINRLICNVVYSPDMYITGGQLQRMDLSHFCTCSLKHFWGLRRCTSCAV